MHALKMFEKSKNKKKTQIFKYLLFRTRVHCKNV